MGLPSVGVISRVPFYLACPQRRKAEWVTALVARDQPALYLGVWHRGRVGPGLQWLHVAGLLSFLNRDSGRIGLNLCGRGNQPCLIKVRQDAYVQGWILPLFKMLAFCSLWMFFFSASILIQPHCVKIVSFIIITEFWGTPLAAH